MPQFNPASPLRRSRIFNFTLFLAAAAWALLARTVASHAAAGLTLRFNLSDLTGLLAALFLLFLLALGYSLLRSISRSLAPLSLLLGLPGRPTARAEFATGAGLGWAMVLAAILPIALAGALHPHLSFQPRSFALLGLNLLTLALSTLAAELVLRGYPYHRLTDALGPALATSLLVLAVGLHRAFDPAATLAAILAAMLLTLLLCLAWRRTHALWLSWGLHFAWIASMGILFGLPVRGSTELTSLVLATPSGPDWLTGADYGPEAAAATLLALLAGLILLFRLTRDYAWNYTVPPIIPAGYPVDIPPPAAHTALEATQASRPTPLVQILPTTPTPQPPPPPAPPPRENS